MRRIVGLIALLALIVAAAWLVRNDIDLRQVAGIGSSIETLLGGGEPDAPPEDADSDVAAAAEPEEPAAEQPTEVRTEPSHPALPSVTATVTGESEKPGAPVPAESAATDAAGSEAPAADDTSPSEAGATSAESTGGGTPESTMSVVPSFDVVRVEPTGETVVAGLAAPMAKVEVLDGAEPVATAEANERGEWAMALEAPLQPGTHDLAVRMSTADGSETILSDQRIAVAVPEDRDQEPLVVLNQPDSASRVLQLPAVQDAPPGTEAAAVDPDKTETAKQAVPPVEIEADAGSEKMAGGEMAAARPENGGEPAVPSDEPVGVTAPPGPAAASEFAPEGTATAAETPAADDGDGAAAPQAEAARQPAAVAYDPTATSGQSTAKVLADGDVAGAPGAEAVARPDGSAVAAGSTAPPSPTAPEEMAAPPGAHSENTTTASEMSAAAESDAAAAAAAPPTPVAEQAAPAQAPVVAMAPGGLSPSTEEMAAKSEMAARSEARTAGETTAAAPRPEKTAEPATAASGPSVAPAGSSPPSETRPEGTASLGAPAEKVAVAPQPTAPAEPEAPSEAAIADAEPEAPAPSVGIAAIEVETNGALYVAGTATTGESVRVYFDEAFVGEAQPTESGTWLLETRRELAPDEYTIRVDQVDAATGAVVARAEVPFQREIDVAVLRQTGESVEAGEAEASATMAGPAKVIIKRGDNLWRLSRKIYGRGVRYSTIYEANRDQIRNPRWIYPGQVFVVPSGDAGWSAE